MDWAALIIMLDSTCKKIRKKLVSECALLTLIPWACKTYSFGYSMWQICRAKSSLKTKIWGTRISGTILSNWRKVGWVWSSRWMQSWIGLLLLTVTDVSTTCHDLCGSHLQSQSELYHVSWWYYTLVIDLLYEDWSSNRSVCVGFCVNSHF